MIRRTAMALVLALGLASGAAPAFASKGTVQTQAFFQAREIGLLQMVNQAVNASHVAGAPLPSDPDGVWDCDNYATSKYRSLRDDFQWSPRRLALGLARLPDGQRHMVVLVRGAGGWAILDNLTDHILPLAERTREGWRVDLADVEPGPPGAAAWVMEPRRFQVELRG